MKKTLLLLLTASVAASVALAQTPIFTKFTPTIFRMTVGSSQCTLWASGVAAPWTVEIACYTGAIVEQIQVQAAGQKMVGHFISPDGVITWLVQGHIWQIAGTIVTATCNQIPADPVTCQGMQNYKEGIFP